MIIPNYVQAPATSTFKSVLGKFYCSYTEEHKGEKYSRYLHPTGWKLVAYWWTDLQEMERTFNQIGQVRLPVTDQEVERLAFLKELSMQDMETMLEKIRLSRLEGRGFNP